MAAWKIAPALAAAIRSCLNRQRRRRLPHWRLAEICARGRSSAGVVNVVTGTGETGAALADIPGWTRSLSPARPKWAKRFSAALAGTRKRADPRTGGKAAQIVFADAALDQAIEGIVHGVYFNQGQVCCAGSRCSFKRTISRRGRRAPAATYRTLRVGDPLDKNTDIGAINSAGQLARIRDLVQRRRGGRALVQRACATPGRGSFYPASFFTSVSPGIASPARDLRAGALGLTFRTADEAVEKANNTPLGLWAGIWTGTRARACGSPNAWRGRRVVLHVQPLRSRLALRWLQESGFGREGGLEGLRPYLTLDA